MERAFAILRSFTDARRGVIVGGNYSQPKTPYVNVAVTDVAPSTVTVHVRRVREKVEQDPSRPRRLVTVFGVGYRWDAEGRG